MECDFLGDEKGPSQIGVLRETSGDTHRAMHAMYMYGGRVPVRMTRATMRMEMICMYVSSSK